MTLAISGKIAKYLSPLYPFIALAGIVLLQSQEYKILAQKLNTADYLAQEQKQSRQVQWQQQASHLDLDNLKADWSYLNFVQYFGDTPARETIGYDLVPEYFRAISEIDPRFTTAYSTLAIANSMYAGYPEKTIALMEEVLKSVDPTSKDAAYLWTSKGLDELLFMGDKQAAIASYKMAAKWQSLESNRPDGLTIKDLEIALKDADEIDLKEAQIRAWSGVLVYVRDLRRQNEIQAKISSLKTELATLKQAKVNNVDDLMR